ncbi:MAG TPA: TfuA-like protein [Dongiaceae bacterium]|nr:TfuA-like protein [Dongiaceae bacterium]
MTVCVFLGPSLGRAAARDTLDALYLPPAGHGDIYRATLLRPKPRVIGLVDGFFRHQPAVRHKEILWAMSEGIHVFGAASIGALRAVELADFGMTGIGRVFDDFQAGVLEDDDEVAVDHGPAELGYPPLNEAMVDIRATLDRAHEQGIIEAPCAAALTAIAKRQLYARRGYPALLDAAAAQGIAPADLVGLRAWLPAGRRSQKRDDALALLAALRDFLATDPPPLAVSYRFERTEAWDADTAFAAPLTPMDGGALRREHLLDEIRLRPEQHKRLRQEALAFALARREADRAGIAVSPQEMQDFLRCWLHERGLTSPAALVAWREANHLGDDLAFNAFIAEQARTQKVTALAADLIEARMIDVLQQRGDYAALAVRAVEKQQALLTSGLADLPLAESDIAAADLLAWFRREHSHRNLPVDAEQLATALSFVSVDAFYRALLREYRYRELTSLKIDHA